MKMQEEVEEWVRCGERLDSLKRDVSRAERDLANQTQKVGRLLAPSDLTTGETVSVWACISPDQERLLTVRKDPEGNYVVGFRGKPRKTEPL